jgi:hypothetical protein
MRVALRCVGGPPDRLGIPPSVCKVMSGTLRSEGPMIPVGPPSWVALNVMPDGQPGRDPPVAVDVITMGGRGVINPPRVRDRT